MKENKIKIRPSYSKKQQEMMLQCPIGGLLTNFGYFSKVGSGTASKSERCKQTNQNKFFE